MQQHFAEPEPFTSVSNRPAGPQNVHVARRTPSYAISVDTLGKLRWQGGDLDGDHLICVVSEQAPEDYFAMLREKALVQIRGSAPFRRLIPFDWSVFGLGSQGYPPKFRQGRFGPSQLAGLELSLLDLLCQLHPADHHGGGSETLQP